MSHPLSGRLARPGILLLLWLTGLYLRIPVLIMPPLEPQVSTELRLGQAAAGALTTLPILILALGALVGSLVIARLGARNAVSVGLALAVAASAARGLAPPVTVLYLATAFMGLGIAIMQPGLVALANRWCASFVALAIGVYMNGMYTGEFLGAGFTRLVVLPLAGGEWREALLLWSLPAAPILAALFIPRGRVADDAVKPLPAAWPDWRNRTLWRLGLILSASSVMFIGTNAYMADTLQAGDDADILQHALFWFNLSQGVASLLMIVLAERLVLRRAPLIATSTLSVVAGVGFVALGSPFGLIAAFVVGMATAMQLTLVIMATPYLARPGEAGRMSAGIFVIGYAIAFGVPLLGGLFAEWVGTPWMAMMPLLVYAAGTIPLTLTLRLKAQT